MVRVFSFSEAGGHPENEDAFLVQAHPQSPDCLLCAVADGQGGQYGGPAARVACRASIEAAARRPLLNLARRTEWVDILAAADQAVYREASAGFTTLVAFAVQGDHLVGASNGDSAAVAVGAGPSVLLLTERQEKNPPVGSGGAAVVPFAAGLSPPWAVLAITDGVWKYAGWESIFALDPLLDGEVILATLQQRARLPGSGLFPDDFTLVVLQRPGGGA
jgi:hypothetical protein